MATVKPGNSPTTYLEINELKITMFAHFYEYHRKCKNKKIGENNRKILTISQRFLFKLGFRCRYLRYQYHQMVMNLSINDSEFI